MHTNKVISRTKFFNGLNKSVGSDSRVNYSIIILHCNLKYKTNSSKLTKRSKHVVKIFFADEAIVVLINHVKCLKRV